MREIGAAVVIARWWREFIGPFLYLRHWHETRYHAALLIQRNYKTLLNLRWFYEWRAERRWAVDRLHKFARYIRMRQHFRQILELAHMKKLNDRR